MALDTRVDMLLEYMTTQDKIYTMNQRSVSGQYSDGSKLAARGVSWWNEALHGYVDPHSFRCWTMVNELSVSPGGWANFVIFD